MNFYPTSFVILTLSLALVACREEASSDPRTEVPIVRGAVVRNAPLATRSFTGTVAARIQSDLGFRVPGKVLERLVDTGQVVRRSQPLMRIDPVDLSLTAHAREEEVRAARAHAKQTADDEARYRILLETAAVSASAYDRAKAAADSAKALLRAAEAQAEVATNATGYSELVADADGVVIETLVEPGQVVSPGQVVVRLAHAGGREAIVQFPETFRPELGSTATAKLFGKEDFTVPAKLRQLSGAADRVVRTYEARYLLEGGLASAPLGATVTIEIPESRPSSAEELQVPLGALFDRGKGPGVWIIAGEPKQVTWHGVEVHSLDEDSARIVGGIRAGTQVVALGAHLLRDGQQVRLKEQIAAATAEGGEQ
jgi:RND family efflux transporter MFP subunit